VEVCISLKCPKLGKEGESFICTYEPAHQRQADMDESTAAG